MCTTPILNFLPFNFELNDNFIINSQFCIVKIFVFKQQDLVYKFLLLVILPLVRKLNNQQI